MKNIKKVALTAIIISTLILSTYMIMPTNADNHQTIPTDTNINEKLPSTALYGCDNIKILGNGSVVLHSFPPLTKEDLMTSIPYPQPVGSSSGLLPYFSWKDNGGDWTAPAQSQGNCGSCWAFSAIGAMQAAINIASHSPTADIDLSEQYVLSCLSSAGNCGGGWMWKALQVIQSSSSGNTGNGINGCTIESCMPYHASSSISCSSKCNDWDYITISSSSKLWQIKDWGWTSSFSENNENHWLTIKTWLINYGPLSVDILASDGLFSYGQTHHSKDDVYQQDDSGMTNHGVVLVGWKDDPTITNGGYWILQNSWYSGWGYENNFFNVAYGCLSFATRCCAWVTVPAWFDEGEGGNNQHYYVSSSFSFESLYPNPEEIIYFKDKSSGPVTLWEWDFNNDGITDSNKPNPTHAFSDVGEYPVTLTVWNEKGLSSIYIRTVAVKTVWPPIAVIDPEYYGAKNPKVSLDGSLSWDVDGYITEYKWNMDNGDIIYGQATTYTFPDIGRIYNVTLTVTDNDGATDTTECDIRIDIGIPPVTSLSIGYGSANQRYFKNSVTICLIANDWTDVKSSYYRINPDSLNQNFITYSEPFMLHDEGTYDIDFYSIDIYGNQEEIKSEQIILDFIPPSLNNPKLSGKLVNDCYVTPVTVSLSGHDTGLSGLDKILYTIDTSELPLPYWSEYNNSIIIAEKGTHNIQACAIDKAGNPSTIKSAQIKVDVKEYPSLEITKPAFSVYIKNEKIFPFIGTSIIIGDINITAKVSLPHKELQVKHVEFYIDDILCHTDTTFPFEWLWHSSNFGTHTILTKTMVNGYTDIFTDEVTAFKLV